LLRRNNDEECTIKANNPLLDRELLSLLVCPRDHTRLEETSEYLSCPAGHRYRIVDGIPILLLSETPQTHVEGNRSLLIAEAPDVGEIGPDVARSEKIDAFVQQIIAGTNGCLYIPLIGKLTEYPIPALRLPRGQGKLFLEIGCNWGRWCVAAERAGYRAVGIDPSLRSIKAARQVAQQLGVRSHYVVADGRYLPFADRTFDQVFSYSVLQHLSPDNVFLVLQQTARVMRPQAGCLVQMPNRFGLRCLYHQARRGFRTARDFEVRYWSHKELTSAFMRSFGSVRITVDGFFSLNPQISDVHLLPPKYRPIIYASEALRKASRKLSGLAYVADSLYITAALPH
jgi:SAM-dependent methyltransferase/uncharacterized protein YbaR (Trm112 family)